ncbi:MAG: PIN domain-containing protein [Luteitalea sp.]|nr:PIN domain-containing protein [Luteitalea sp.]
MSLLVDTGVIYALADRSDEWHLRVRTYLEETRELMTAPVTILPEVAYLLHTRLGPAAERKFTHSLAMGEVMVEAVTTEDLVRCEELLGKYPAIGLVDASVVAVAERLGLVTLATTDRRDFTLVRPKHVEQFRLVP